MQKSKEHAMFYITCIPNAKRNHIERITDKDLKVWIKKPPEKGLANEALIALLAEYFDISKSQIKIIKGHTSRKKLLQLYNVQPT